VEVIKLAQVVKEIKGHKYLYEVIWDPKKKKQIWKYLGKAEVTVTFDPDKLNDDIYKAIKEDYRIRISKKDIKHIKNVVGKVIERHK